LLSLKVTLDAREARALANYRASRRVWFWRSYPMSVGLIILPVAVMGGLFFITAQETSARITAVMGLFILLLFTGKAIFEVTKLEREEYAKILSSQQGE
jgi:hypothetical protein